MKKLIFFAGTALIIAIGIVLIVNNKGEEHGKYSIFSWKDTIISAEERPTLLSIVDQMNIGSIYQSFSKELLASQETELFVSEMHEYNIDIYYLTGEPEWGLEADGQSLIQEIMKVDVYNQKVEKSSRLKGIVIDVEPHVLDEWGEADDKGKVKLLEALIDGLEAAYQVAQDKNLIVIVTIPHFYDKYSLYELDRLVALTGDGIAVMNYNRRNEHSQLQNEVLLAKKYKKQVINIAELQPPGKHKLEDNNTYYNAGLDELQKSWDSLYESFQYHNLSFSYHYYEYLKEMLDR